MKNKLEEYKNCRIIRLVYNSIEKYVSHQGSLNFGYTIVISSPFLLPEGVSFEDACKIISYLSEKVEREENIEPASKHSVARVSHILENYGFQKLNAKDFGYDVTFTHGHGIYNPISTIKSLSIPKAEGVVDFITVGGNVKMFNKTTTKKRYFDWFIPSVSNSNFNEIIGKFRKPEKTNDR